MAGRPKKIIESGSAQMTIQLPTAVIGVIKAQKALRGYEHDGPFVRDAVMAYSDLLPRLEESEKRMDEMRDMMSKIEAMMRRLTVFIADRERTVDQDLADMLADSDFEA